MTPGRRATAAVARQPGGSFSVEDVELSAPRPDEILVDVVASGMCHTDLLVRDSRPESLPAVLGHEGAGSCGRPAARSATWRPATRWC